MALVLGFGLGIAGAAIGTALAEVLGVGPRHRGAAPPRLEPARRHVGRRSLNRAAMLQNLAMNRDIMIRNVALILAFSIFSALGARDRAT